MLAYLHIALNFLACRSQCSFGKTKNCEIMKTIQLLNNTLQLAKIIKQVQSNDNLSRLHNLFTDRL